MSEHKADKKLQAKLREMIDEETITEVASRFGMSRESLAKYLANLPLHMSSFLGIESAVDKAVWPRAEGSEARQGGLRR